MLSFSYSAIRRARVLTAEIVAISHVPWPMAKMLRNGSVIGAGFAGLLLAGKVEGALICAFFTNLMMFVDEPGPLRERLLVLLAAAGASAFCGILGALAAPSNVLVFAGTFCLALCAGVIHGSVRGIDAIPRFATICFVAGAFLPVVNRDSILGVWVGSMCALAGAIIEDLWLRRKRNIADVRPGFSLNYPGLRFSLAYGGAAVCGLALGQAWGDARPYWLTITTLLVMQTDPRTNMFRAFQRFIGTIIGVLAAFSVVFVLPEASRSSVIIALGLVMPFIWPLGYARNYGLGVAILSTWILLLLDLALPPTELISAILAARLSDTTVGCGLALAGAFNYNEAAAKRSKR
jgi:hypothetical protein